MNKILLLTNNIGIGEVFRNASKKYNLDVITRATLNEGQMIMSKGRCGAVVVTTPLLYEICPKKILEKLQKANLYLPVFFLIDHLELDQVISLTKLGAENCFSKPYMFENIIENIKRAIRKIPHPQLYLQNYKEGENKYLEAKSTAAQYLYNQIDQVKDTNFKVIIYGETGTGKESVAHRLCNGIYKDKPFIAVDCGCLNKELAASELFGHKKGSFSGAFEDKMGAFEAANHGTLFLDEIGNLDYSVQILLLRAIEEKKIKRVGSNNEIDVHVRIISASNENLAEAVKKGNFREDLYYRLNEFEINIPPLKERLEDLESFINFFISAANRDLNKQIKGVENSLLEKFYHYHWNGNIRELKNVIRRGCLIATKLINHSCMSKEFLDNLNYCISKKNFTEKHVLSIDSTTVDLKQTSLYAEYLEIIKVLKEENFNKTKAAKRLNINRRTLHNKLKYFDSMKEE